MPMYTYTAFDATGKRISGELDAESEGMVVDHLIGQDAIPDRIRKKRKTNPSIDLFALLPGAGVKAGDMILFTKQFKTLLHAGVGIMQIFKVLQAQTENKMLRKVTARLASDVREGATLFKAFSAHPRIFSKLYCAMIRAGETSGALPRVLDRLIYIIEHEEKVRNDIKAAVRYPVIVLLSLGVSFFIMLTYVVPKFVGIFQKAGLDLPLPTRICMAMYEFLHNYWPFVILGSVGLVIFLVQAVKTKHGRLIKDRLVLAIPILGPVFIKTAMSRFSSIFSILQSSGITVLSAMKVLADTINNSAVTNELDKVRTEMEEGRGISGPLSRAKYFTPMVINMVAIGEESGNLDDMLREIATHYDAEVEYATKGLADALGPVLMVGLAAVVGFFAFAIFLPMWDLTKMV
ncbi:MAG: type II secretion system F family protein [Desulfobacterales bacterium]|nr:type II secretion system F family protein [Desulfobacterales bacterium]